MKEDSFQIGFELNQKAMKYEKQGKMDLAIEYFEKAVSVGFIGSYPYQQLTKIYQSQKRYSDVVRVIRAYKNTFKDDYFDKSMEGKMIWFRKQLAEALLLKDKSE